MEGLHAFTESVLERGQIHVLSIDGMIWMYWMYEHEFCSIGLSINLDLQEDKAASVRIMNDMSAALKGRAVQVILFTFELGTLGLVQRRNLSPFYRMSRIWGVFLQYI